MERDKNSSFQESEKAFQTKKFLEKYTPTLVTIIGTATFMGGIIWLTARYLRESKKRDTETDNALAQIENEASSSNNEATVFLETGSYLSKVGGDELIDVTEELCQSSDDPEINAAFELVYDLSVNLKNENSCKK